MSIFRYNFKLFQDINTAKQLTNEKTLNELALKISKWTVLTIESLSIRQYIHDV